MIDFCIFRKPCDCAPNYNRRDKEKRKSSCGEEDEGGGGESKKAKGEEEGEEEADSVGKKETGDQDSKDELGEMVRSPTVETGQSDENSIVTSVSRSSNKRNSNSISSRISLKSLQEMVSVVENFEKPDDFLIRRKLGMKSDPSKFPTSKQSLHILLQALTVFLRENWESTKYELIDVALHRDPALGLGITVAGYVHKKG